MMLSVLLTFQSAAKHAVVNYKGNDKQGCLFTEPFASCLYQTKIQAFN